MSGQRWYWPRKLFAFGPFALWIMPTMWVIGATYYPARHGLPGSFAVGAGPFSLHVKRSSLEESENNG